MKLTFSQSIILACVASSALAAAVPLETREPRGIRSRKHTDIVGVTSDTAASQISSSLDGRDIGDDFLVEREPARGRGRSRSASNAAQGVGSFAGALAAQQLNQQNEQNSVSSRGLDIDESLLEIREFEDDLLVERSPRGGFGRSRSRSSSRGQGRRRRRHRHNHNHTGPHRQADSGASAAGDASTSNSDGASNMETRDFEDNLLVERSPKKHKAKKAKGSNNKKPAHLKAAHEDDVEAVADEVTAGLKGRDFEDDLLFERDPRGGRGRGFGRHAAEAAHAAGSEVAANLETRDFEDDLLFEREPRGGRGRSIGRHAGSFLGEAAGEAGAAAAANLQDRDFEDDLLLQRSPRGGRGGGGRSGGGRSGGGRSSGRSGGRRSGGRMQLRPQRPRKPSLPHHAPDLVGEVTQQVASNIENRELGEDALVQREPFHPFRRARKHSNNIANAAGAAGSEVAPSAQESP